MFLSNINNDSVSESDIQRPPASQSLKMLIKSPRPYFRPIDSKVLAGRHGICISNKFPMWFLCKSHWRTTWDR